MPNSSSADTKDGQGLVGYFVRLGVPHLAVNGERQDCEAPQTGGCCQRLVPPIVLNDNPTPIVRASSERARTNGALIHPAGSIARPQS